jgi:hypothetical protein
MEQRRRRRRRRQFQHVMLGRIVIERENLLEEQKNEK